MRSLSSAESRTWKTFRCLAVTSTILVSAGGLTGCNNGFEGAVTGAGLGAVAGLIAGSVFGEAGAGAAVGAAVGGIGGAVIGDQNERNAYRTVYVDGDDDSYESDSYRYDRESSRRSGDSYYREEYRRYGSDDDCDDRTVTYKRTVRYRTYPSHCW